MTLAGLALERDWTAVPATPSNGMSLDTQTLGGAVLLQVSGVVDMVTAPHLRVRVDELLRVAPDALIVDLTDVEFLASAGMEVLLHAAVAVRPGTALAVVADGPVTGRPMRLVGLDEILDVYPTRSAALDRLTE